jgi:DNA-binding CsgD family transcriptional regulator
MPTIRGREAQCATLDRLLRFPPADPSAALVLRGEAGLGKTTLLDYAARRADACRVVRTVGIESERELPFAALHQFCVPFLDRLDRLPSPQRHALESAFGLSSGPTSERFLVGLAALALLSDAAGDQPVLCLVDDAQWLDRFSAQTLSFVARRLPAAPVIILFATENTNEPDELSELPALQLPPLSDADARAVLASAHPGPLDPRVRDRLIAEARGNPLALLELPRRFAACDLAGGFGVPGASLPDGFEVAYGSRLRQLPRETQLLLLVAAAEPTGDSTLLWRAARALGIPATAAGPAEADGLFTVGTRVMFCHPLVRSVAYHGAPPEDRSAAHRALSGSIDPGEDPDGHAWHCGRAATAPDETVAGQLQRSAGPAQRRAGLAAAAAFLEEATRLSEDPGIQAERALAAAEAKTRAGAPGAALPLLSLARTRPLEPLQQARAQLVDARITVAARPGGQNAHLLLDAAQRLEKLDAVLARDAYLEAFEAALLAGHEGNGADLAQLGSAARRAPAVPTPGLTDVLLEGLAELATGAFESATPLLATAIRTFCDGELPPQDLRWVSLAETAAGLLWDDDAWHTLATRNTALMRETGALGGIASVISSRMFVQAHSGELDEIAASVDELRMLTDAAAPQLRTCGEILHAAWRGNEANVSGCVAAAPDDRIGGRDRTRTAIASYGAALLYNGLGRYAEARTAAERVCDYGDLTLSGWGLAELVEAAVRSGQRETAAAALRDLHKRTGGCGTQWARGVEARSRALLSEGDAAERLYREAIDRLSQTRCRPESARSHLLYGEWLRRQNRRVDARVELRCAHDAFTSLGIQAFAERARRELLATGDIVRRRSVETRFDLTAQEAEIARLAGEGLTNPEIGAQLFLSARTVEWHLRKVFAKVGISSRKELRPALERQRLGGSQPAAA